MQMTNGFSITFCALGQTTTKKRDRRKITKTHYIQMNYSYRTTYESTKLLKILLLLAPLVVLKLLALEPNAIEMGDVVNDRGPPTSIGESALAGIGLPPECWDVLKSLQKIITIFSLLLRLKVQPTERNNFYLKPGDAEPALPEHDLDIDWWLIMCVVDDCGRSKSESVRGLCGGTLELMRSSSLSPIMSGDDSRLCSVLFVMIGVFSPLSRFRCSSLRRSALRHFARRFWNQTYTTAARGGWRISCRN